MKNIRYFFICLAVAAFSSCDNITEEMHINADGTGQYAFYSDMIPGISMMASSMANLFNEDSTMEPASGNDALDELIWKEFPDVIDSAIHYSEFVPDSVIMDDESKVLIQKMDFFMEGGRSKGYVNMGFRYNFPDFDDLERVLKKVEENQQSSGAGGGMMPGLDEMKTEIKYSMKENVISRRTVFINQPDLKETDTEMLKMFMGEATMKTIVHLPRKVKDAKGAGLKTINGKTVTFEYTLLEYMFGSVSGDFDITMEE